MPPRKRGRGGHAAATPPASRTGDDSMDIDTPQASATPVPAPAPRATPATAPPPPPPVTAAKAGPLKYNELWTDDQIASLFKGCIRWKPAGTSPPRASFLREMRGPASDDHVRQGCTSTSE